MPEIQILNYTAKPLSFMGLCASTCWNSKPKDLKRVALECIANGHGRVLEYADIVIKISGYSARMIRELYTHIVGVSRLQESTRYINYNNFNYYTPNNFSEEQKQKYDEIMKNIMQGYKELLDLGVSKEDAANVLPLGMHTTIVLKINVRALLHLAEVRMCNRAYKEFRAFMRHLKEELAKIDDEWAVISSLLKPKCEIHEYCIEKYSCGKMPKKSK